MIKASDSQKKRVVVGITGRLDSIVAAYLLKKQGFETICIAIQFAPSPDKEQKLTTIDDDDYIRSPFLGVCLISDLSQIKNICDQIGLTFYAVDASSQYQAEVTDRIVGAKLGGISFSPEVYATNLIFKVLFEKSLKLGADLIATGHYAKVVKNQTNNSYSIFIANDLENDQSYLLSLLDQKTLGKIIFPFSEMRKIEVTKIAQQMIHTNLLLGDSGLNIMKDEHLSQFVTERAPYSMFKEGVVMDYLAETVITDHEGIHNYHLEENEIKSKSGLPLDKAISVLNISYSSGAVSTGYIDEVGYKMIIVENSYFSSDMDFTKPINVYVKSGPNSLLHQATLYFKNNNFCVIEFLQEVPGVLSRGVFLAFYNKQGVSSKLLGGGVVRSAGQFKYGTFYELPPEEDYSDDEREIVDIYEFNF